MDKDKRALWGVTLLVACCFCALIGHYYYIMVIQATRWEQQAARQHKRVTVQMPQRGVFYSNTAILTTHPSVRQPLVIDVEKYHLHLDALAIPEEFRQEIVGQLTTILSLNLEKQQQLFADLERKTHNRKIASWLTRGEKTKILQWWQSFAKKRRIASNALFFIKDSQRTYPFGKLLGQVLHTLAEYKDEKTHEAIPTGGIELHFNQLLKGKSGKKPWIQSPRHILESEEGQEAQQGADFELTVNHYLQAVVEEELEKGVTKAAAKGGWAILMDPSNGHILALAQYPFFYPEQYRLYFNDPKKIEETKVKAITDANEVGSVMKPLTLAICLQANKELLAEGLPPLFTPEEKIPTLDGRVAGRRKPITDLHPRRFLNMPMAIQKSSNVYMTRLIDRLLAVKGAEWYRDWLVRLGFGEKVGIELPGESPGFLPRFGKKHPNGALEWSTSTPYSLAIGYNLMATSLQLVRIYAMLANGGFWVQPTLVRTAAIKDRLLIDHRQVKARDRVLDKEIVTQVVSMMKYSTKTGGTAPAANIWGYTEAGKTGTTEKVVGRTYSKRNNISTFIGFAPLTAPKFVLLVAIDEPEPVYIPGVGKNTLGGICAAPLFRQIGTRVLEYLGVEPDDPHGYPSNDPRYDAAKADWIKEVQELRRLYNEWNGP